MSFSINKVADSNIQSQHPSSTADPTAAVFSTKDLVQFICDKLASKDAKDLICFASTNQHLKRVVLSYAPLWTSLLHKYFPNFYAKHQSQGKPDTESLSPYKQLQLAHKISCNMKIGKYRPQILNECAAYSRRIEFQTAPRMQILVADDSCMGIEIANDRLLIAGSCYGLIKIWDLETNEIVRTLTLGDRGHGDTRTISCTAITPNGTQFMAGTDDGTVTILALNNNFQEQTLKHSHGHMVVRMAIIPNREQLITGSGSGDIVIWDLKTKEFQTLTKDPEGAIDCMVVTPNGEQLVTGLGNDGTIKIRDLKTKELRQIRGHEQGIYCMAITPNGEQLITGSFDNTINVWNLNSFEKLGILKGHKDVVKCIEMIDGHRLVSGSKDGTMKIWDIRTFQELRTLNMNNWTNVNERWVDWVKFSNGKLIYSTDAGSIRILDFNPDFPETEYVVDQ